MFFDRLSARIAARPGLVLGVVLLTLLPTGWLASKLHFEGSFFAMLPERAKAVVDLKRGIDRTGGSAFAILAVDASDRPSAERFADEAVIELKKLDSVRYAEARREWSFVRDRALLYLTPDRLEAVVDEVAEEIDQRTVAGAGLGLDLEDAKTATKGIDLDRSIDEEFRRAQISTDPYSVGKDGKYLYIFIAVKGDAGDIGRARKTKVELDETIARMVERGAFPRDRELRLSGTIVVRLEDDAQLRADLGKASGISFVGVLLLLVLYTRRIRTLIVLALPLICGICWTMAFAQVAIGRLNILSGFLVTILSGLGVEFGIHLLLRYLEARGRGEAAVAAQATSLRTTGRSIIGSGLTNAGAFLVLSFAGFKGFSEFGLIAAVGMILTLLVTLLVFPATNLLLERVSSSKVAPLSDAAVRGLVVPRPLRTLILVAMPIMFIVSIGFMSTGNPKFRTNWREIKGKSPASDFNDYITDSLGSPMTQTMILVDKRADLATVETVLDKHIADRKAKALPSGLRDHLSLRDIVPPEQDEKMAMVADLKKQLDRVDPARLDEKGRAQLARAKKMTEVVPFDLDEVPPSLKQRLLTADGQGNLVLLRSTYRFYESEELTNWADELDSLAESLAAAGVDAPVISENWVTGSIFRIIKQDGPFILIATVVIVFLIVLVDFRRLSHAALVMGALLIGQVSVAGVMSLLGMELNFMNIAVLPIIVGVSIDNAMHIFHRYLEEGPSSIPLVMRHTVSGTTLSSATNLMGFGAMIVAQHGGLQSIAKMAIVGVSLTFLSTSLFFPLALEWWGERKART